MEEWWKHHSSNPNDPEWKQWLTRFTELLAIKNEELMTDHVNILDGVRVFGMSKAAGPTRAGALHILGHEPEPFSGSTNFTFWLGHTVEIAALTTLEAIGFPLLDSQAEVKLYDGDKPVAQSKSDSIIKIFGEPTIVSCKSAAYKMSGQQKGKFIRRGFPELPFEGVRKSQPGAYAQAQLELLGSGLKQCLMLYVSKDIVKAFENDEYLGDKGNGSLTFYAELIHPEVELQTLALNTLSEQIDYIYNEKKAGPCYYLRSDTMQYVELERANVQPSNIWGGKNKEITGTFNPCGGCQYLKACANAE